MNRVSILSTLMISILTSSLTVSAKKTVAAKVLPPKADNACAERSKNQIDKLLEEGMDAYFYKVFLPVVQELVNKMPSPAESYVTNLQNALEVKDEEMPLVGACTEEYIDNCDGKIGPNRLNYYGAMNALLASIDQEMPKELHGAGADKVSLAKVFGATGVSNRQIKRTVRLDPNKVYFDITSKDGKVTRINFAYGNATPSGPAGAEISATYWMSEDSLQYSVPMDVDGKDVRKHQACGILSSFSNDPVMMGNGLIFKGYFHVENNAVVSVDRTISELLSAKLVSGIQEKNSHKYMYVYPIGSSGK